MKVVAFSASAKWHTVDYVDGIKVLAPKNPKASMNLPERSNTPGTSYVLYRKNGDFDQLRVFKADRTPLLDIDYGTHRGEKTLHVHYFFNGKRAKQDEIIFLKKGHPLYEKYKNLFKGAIL